MLSPVIILELPVLGEKGCTSRSHVDEPNRRVSVDKGGCSSDVAVAVQCRSEEPVAPFVQFAEFAGHLGNYLPCLFPS